MVRYAGFWIRLVADFIDSLILSVAAWGVAVALLGAFKFATSSTISAFGEEFFELGIYGCLSFPYYVYGHLRWGQTVGKRILGVKVVNYQDRKPITLKQSIIRFVGYGVSAIPMMGGYIMAAWQPQKLALHDLMANTMSIRLPRKQAAA
jgi:uncharacterized RDD family membrane protein YckC